MDRFSPLVALLIWSSLSAVVFTVAWLTTDSARLAVALTVLDAVMKAGAWLACFRRLEAKNRGPEKWIPLTRE